MLEVRDLVVEYGRVRALKGVSLQVQAGELVTVIGSNGAGKTTLMKTISSLLKVKQGEIFFQNQSTKGKSVHEVASLGVAHVPEGRKIFAQLSVESNLLLGGYLLKKRSGLKAVHTEMDSMYQMFPVLHEKRKLAAGLMSGGEQQMLAIARALMMKPRLLILDEPTMGLAPILIGGVLQAISRLKGNREMAILLVEQRGLKALEIADRGYVLEQGQVRLEGPAKHLLESSEVQKVYLG